MNTSFHFSPVPAARSRGTFFASLAALAIVLCFIHPAAAFINMKFTPVDLVSGSEQIWEIKLAPIVKDKIEATVSRTLKGKKDVKTLTLDLSHPPDKEHRDDFEKAMKNRDNATDPCLFFAGPSAQADPDSANPVQSGTAYLHMDGIWVIFTAQTDGSWRMTWYNNTDMTGTWRGATDMLGRAVEYILADPDAEFPVRDGVAWDDHSQFAQLEGKINGCAAVDLLNDGTISLFVAADNGDRFFSYDAVLKTLKDVTPIHASASKSKLFAWGDFNGDGKLDLASSDGKNVGVYIQNSQGKLDPLSRLYSGAIKGNIVSLAVAAGTGHKTGVLICTESSLLLWMPLNESDAPTLLSDGSAAKSFGKAGQCLVADFDGDHLPDIIQFFENGAIVCKGKGDGTFEQPRPIAIRAGAGRCVAFVGDYDADGMLDIVTASADACSLWQNQGKFNFIETRFLSGELGYKATGGAVAGFTCDFNNDGRQDLALFYSIPVSPQLFFNRGFRSFGFASDLASDLERTLPKDSQGRQQGQQAGCIADFNGDGGQDMMVILNSGQCWFFPIVPPDNALAIHAVLPFSAANPVTVTGWHESQCLGAWNVVSGCSEALVAWKESGPLTIKWQFPEGKPQSREIALEQKPVRFVIPPDAKE